MRRRRLFPALGAGGGWSPLQLGPSLIAWWDAERSDLITESGGLVSSWRDVVAGYDAVQAIGGAQPVWSAGVVTSDGVDDELTMASYPEAFPDGAEPIEEWFLCRQDALAADPTVRTIGGSGGGASTTTRVTSRIVDGGVNRARSGVGTAAGTVTAVQTTTDLSGWHVVRLIYDGTNLTMEVDGVASAPSAATATAGAVRLRHFANNATTAASFWEGAMKVRLMTTALSAAQATLLYAYLNRRL